MFICDMHTCTYLGFNKDEMLVMPNNAVFSFKQAITGSLHVHVHARTVHVYRTGSDYKVPALPTYNFHLAKCSEGNGGIEKFSKKNHLST